MDSSMTWTSAARPVANTSSPVSQNNNLCRHGCFGNVSSFASKKATCASLHARRSSVSPCFRIMYVLEDPNKQEMVISNTVRTETVNHWDEPSGATQRRSEQRVVDEEGVGRSVYADEELLRRVALAENAESAISVLSQSCIAPGRIFSGYECSKLIDPALARNNPNLAHSVLSAMCALKPQRRLARSGSMASVSSVAPTDQEDSTATSSKDLLVVGPGVLGKRIAGLWMKEYPGCTVAGETVTTNHHEELQSFGIKPLLKGNHNDEGFPFVVFCAPPSGSSDYAGELRLAAKQWNGEGVFLFTSSSAVYDCMDNGNCDEDTPIVPLGRSPRTDVLLCAEQEVIQVGGTVVRLAGLYTKERGPHAYWLKKGIVDARPDHILNVIHYEDAASLCVTILKKGYRKEFFMGCDNHPLSRQEVMDLVNASGKFEEKFEAFTGTEGPLGKKMNNDKTRSRTGWQPKYVCFAEFLQVA